VGLNCGKKVAYDRADIGCVVARQKSPGRSEVDFADKLLSAMRYQFGWHLEKSDGNSEAA
jgi:6-phosphogluconate dehydrogenase (decarboxylating)